MGPRTRILLLCWPEHRSRYRSFSGLDQYLLNNNNIQFVIWHLGGIDNRCPHTSKWTSTIQVSSTSITVVVVWLLHSRTCAQTVPLKTTESSGSTTKLQ